MGGFFDVDEGIQAGERIENEDIGTNAGISPLKFEKRSLYLTCPLGNFVLTGTGISANTYGSFPTVLFTNGNSNTITGTIFAPRGEMAPGDTVKCHLFWNTSATSGNARWLFSVKPALDGVSSLSSAFDQYRITPAQGSANVLQITTTEFPQGVFANTHLIGLQINRDSTNTLDTISADIRLVCVVLEFQGHC